MKQKIENKHLKNISRSVLGITFCIYGMQGSRKKSSQKTVKELTFKRATGCD